MSISTECRDAVRALLEDPNVATQGIKGVFTEIDVILLAARMAGGYTEDEMRVAQRDASQAMGEFFGNRQVARYGPVSLKESLGFDQLDYARHAAKILYAHAERGPAKIQTPNGTFPRMMVEDDDIKRPGRRLGANRSDLISWAEQDILANPVKKTKKATTPEQREIIRLKTENAAQHTRILELEAELHRLREHKAEAISRSEVESMVGSLKDRLSHLEEEGRGGR